MGTGLSVAVPNPTPRNPAVVRCRYQLPHLETAAKAERIAVIRHIDGFLSSTTPEGKIFRLKIRERIKRLNER